MTKPVARYRTKITFDKIAVNLTDKSMQQTMNNAVLIAKNSILDTNKNGKKYYNLPNRSSDIGEAPANQTGALASSIFGAKIPQRKTIRGFILGSNEDYAAALEFGYSPRNLKARPYIRPAVQKAMRRYVAIDSKTEHFIRDKAGKIQKRKIY